MSKQKVPLKSELVSDLVDLIRPEYVLPVLPEGCAEVVSIEHQGDVALHREQFDVALDLYKSLTTTVQRVRYKMAWCHYRLGQSSTAIPLLHDAEKADGTFPVAQLCYALLDVDNRQHQFTTSENSVRIAALLRNAVNRPDPVAQIYLLAARYLYGDERETYMLAAYQRYPGIAKIRQNYLYLAARKHLIPEQSLLDIAMQAAVLNNATAADIWVALKIARQFDRSDETTGALRLLKMRAADSPKLLLVEADAALQFGRLQEALRLFAHVLEQAESLPSEEDRMCCIAWALRGMIHIAILSHDSDMLALYATQHAKRYIEGQYQEKWSGLYDEPKGFLEDMGVSIQVGDEVLEADPLTDLKMLEDQLLTNAIPDEIRGIYRIFFLVRDWNTLDWSEAESGDLERQKAAVLDNLDKAITETRHPSIELIVGTLELKRNRFEEAGYAIATYSLSRLQAFGEGELYNVDVLGDDVTEQELHAFTDGVCRCFRQNLNQNPQLLTLHGREVVHSVLRQRLLDGKHYLEFDALMQLIEQSAQEEESDSLDENAWFDIGLGHHFMKRKDAAIAAYQRCLNQDPDFQAAQQNLDLLLPSETKRQRIQMRYISGLVRRPPPASLGEMSFMDAVYLLALFRACGGLEQDSTLRPFADSEFPFAPVSELRQPLFDLLRCGLVHISPDSPPDAFTVDLSENAVTGVFMHKLVWELPAYSLNLLKAVESAAITGKWPKTWHEQAPALAMELALGECLEYLEHAADERGFEIPQGEKPRIMFENLLTTYSVAQCYALIYRGARNAADYSQRKYITKTHASNLMISSIQRYADTARAEGWDIKPYSRIKECPRTVLSYVLHDTFLRTGDRAFDTMIAKLFDKEA